MATERERTYCIDCGKETAGGKRCRRDHGAYIRARALEETTERDRELLEMIARENLNGQRLATRLGVSKVYVSHRIRLAKDRTARRAALA